MRFYFIATSLCSSLEELIMAASSADRGWERAEARGRGQRLLAAEAMQPVVCSCVASYLVTLWAWGLMSPQIIQAIASQVLKDMDKAAQGPDAFAQVRAEVGRLAHIGSDGAYEGNMRRDLKDMLQPTKLMLYRCRMPINIRATLRSPVYLLSQCMLLPHMLFAAMGNCYVAAFEKLICPSRERLAEFWQNMSGNPQLESTL